MATNPELVEHVAKVLYNRGHIAPWDEASDKTRTYCRADAQAVLDAIAAFLATEADARYGAKIERDWWVEGE